MYNLIEYLKCGLLSALLAFILIPILKIIAFKVKLVDQPNTRKVHSHSVPLVGGISIVFSSGLALILSPYFPALITNFYGVFISSLFLFAIGILDDRFDIKAKHKLLLQLACAYTLASHNIRVTSFYGLFNIYELPLIAQYLVTMLMIAGIVNAFNLMDGVDGLAGGLSILGFGLFLAIGILTGNNLLILISASFIGSILIFLKNNVSQEKIFMGDSGSLFLGFVLVALAIHTIEHPISTSAGLQNDIRLTILAFFSVPTLDSLRVYRNRIKNGNSPFKADKTHLHHLLLSTGLKHKRITLIIVLFAGTLILFVVGAKSILTLSIATIIIFITYGILTAVLQSINEMNKWKEKIKQLEL